MVTASDDGKKKNSHEDWTEKYRPKELSNVVGNESATTELKNWASKWVSGKPSKNAVILAGKAGIGKTTSAFALANEMGWEYLEMNASDKRNRDSIKSFVGRSAVDDTFSKSGDFEPYKEGKRTLLVVDEADNIFGNEDRGGINEIKQTIQRTEQPIVLIANDYYDLTRRSNELKKLCKKIEFEPVEKEKIVRLLKEICKSEGVEYDIGALRAIAKRSEGDVRSAVRDLESVALGRKERISRQDIGFLGSRDREAEIFPTLTKILQNKDPIKARESVRFLDEEPADLMIWIDENLPREYSDERDLAAGYEWLSKADVYLGRVMSRQWYRSWAYAKDIMTAGVSSAKNKAHRGWTKYAFPTWIRKMSSSKGVRNIKRRIGRKLAPEIHSTTTQINSDLFSFLQGLFKREEDIRKDLIDSCDLQPDEVAYLLETKADSKEVRSLFPGKEEEEEKTGKKEEEKEEERKRDEGKEKEEAEEDEKQKSLLEF
ncbi:MAG: replication factor C large subunit [Candidatus Thermoplasmatota archaeon]|nr:replication factor C large subunit [Candidatus Thermoplasmatota archaeon]